MRTVIAVGFICLLLFIAFQIAIMPRGDDSQAGRMEERKALPGITELKAGRYNVTAFAIPTAGMIMVFELPGIDVTRPSAVSAVYIPVDVNLLRAEADRLHREHHNKNRSLDE